MTRAAALLTIVLALAVPWGCMAEGPTARPFFGLALDGYPLDAAAVSRAERSAGAPAGMVVFYLQWPENPRDMAFPLATLQAIDALGAAACLTWEPMAIVDGRERAVPAGEITGGRWDAALDAFAVRAREWGRPLVLRFAHEPNLSRYHWGTDAHGYGPDSPALYRAMFRHVAGRFERAGARNVLFAFCPNAESVPALSWDPTAGWNTASAYWPGADAVDVLGMDGYNWGTTQTKDEHGWDSSWRDFEDVFGPLHRELRQLAPALPMAVFETASAARGGDKGRWVRRALATVRDWSLAGLVWFEADKEVDWRLLSGADQDVSRAVRDATGPALQWVEKLAAKKAARAPSP